MSVFRQVVRKADSDGVASLIEESKREFLQERVLRRYVDHHIDYDQHVTTVGDLAASNELDSVDRLSPEPIEIPRKVSIGDSECVTAPDQYEPEPQLCGILRDATLLPATGLVSTADQRFVVDSVGPTHLASRRISVALAQSGYRHGIAHLRSVLPGLEPQPQPKTTVSEAIVLLPLWSNYFHWSIECLLKLHWLERNADLFSDTAKIVVPTPLSSWMQESLSLLGYDETEYITIDDPCVTVKRLLIPSQIDPVPEHVQWLQSRMSAAVGQPEERARIYISRRNATKRRVRNESEVVSALQTRGFERYVLEELSVAEQIELFADAEAVVGPHGAGFANLVYAETPLVVELFGQKRLNTYHRLSTALGFQYEPIYADARGCDLVVDTETLLERIDDGLN